MCVYLKSASLPAVRDACVPIHMTHARAQFEYAGLM